MVVLNVDNIKLGCFHNVYSDLSALLKTFFFRDLGYRSFYFYFKKHYIYLKKIKFHIPQKHYIFNNKKNTFGADERFSLDTFSADFS